MERERVLRGFVLFLNLPLLKRKRKNQSRNCADCFCSCAAETCLRTHWFPFSRRPTTMPQATTDFGKHSENNFCGISPPRGTGVEYPFFYTLKTKKNILVIMPPIRCLVHGGDGRSGDTVLRSLPKSAFFRYIPLSASKFASDFGNFNSKFWKFSKIWKKFPNSDFFSKISKTTEGPLLTSKGPLPPF